MTDQDKPTPAAIDGFDNTVYVTNDDDYFSLLPTSDTLRIYQDDARTQRIQNPATTDHIYPVLIDEGVTVRRLSLDIDVSKCKFDAPSNTFFAYEPEPITESHSWPIEVSIHRGGLKLVTANQKPFTDNYGYDEYHNNYSFEKNSSVFCVRLYLTEKLRDYWFAMHRAARS